jgi:hypothetical protein
LIRPRLEFLLHPALADPDDEPTVAEPVERREPARKDERALEECVETRWHLG